MAEDETLHRNRLWCQRFSIQRVGIAAVDHQLTIVEQGQYAVELLVRIGLAAFVASYDIALMNLDGCEILGDAAVQGKGCVVRTGGEKVVKPRQKPRQQERGREI